MINYNDNIKNELIDKINEYSIDSKSARKTLEKRHLNSFSTINIKKINEWKKHFNEEEVEKVDFICKPITEKFGYECSSKKVTLTIKDKYYILLAKFDYFISCKYLLLPIKYKRILRAINIFKFYR
jgi:hypothetical protein